MELEGRKGRAIRGLQVRLGLWQTPRVSRGPRRARPVWLSLRPRCATWTNRRLDWTGRTEGLAERADRTGLADQAGRAGPTGHDEAGQAGQRRGPRRETP